jgi:hypothetical protein
VVAVVYQWLEEHLPTSRRGRMILAIALAIVVLVPSVGLLIVTLVVPDLTDKLEGFGYAGVFLANLASTATVFIPVPGLTAAGQTRLSHRRSISTRSPSGRWGTGMRWADLRTPVAQPGHRRTGGRLQAPEVSGQPSSGSSTVDWLMDHYGFATLFVLSAIPNPLFEVAGLTAGASDELGARRRADREEHPRLLPAFVKRRG